ncbi:MAG TPA: ATP-binding protein [Rubricoccaceae bacterium]|nr:ATP-binding protein [Rubricoccaceae bacterium]
MVRLADRLSAARQAQFVGRAAETALFREALRADDLPFHLLHVYGPGGIGKSTLLRQFAGMAAEAGARPLRLDGRNVDASPAGFEAALAAALGLPADASPGAALEARPERHVLLVDTFELLAPLETWLREVFLPELPAHTLVVLAGRQPLGPEWMADPGWQALARSIRLVPLSLSEGRDYLTRRAVADDQQDAVLGFTRGHPLALSLVADLFEQRPGFHFEPEAAPDVITALLEQFVQRVPGPAHRAALEACALVRVTTEALLAEMVGVEDAHELFAWLRRVSFVEAGPFGLFPHDLARDALVADLRWRNPDWFAALHTRARGYYARRLTETSGVDQQRVLSDYVFLHRDNPVIKPFLDWQDTGSAVPEAPTDADWPRLRALIAHHEGEPSAEIAERWFARFPRCVLVFRGPDRAPAAFLFQLPLHEVTEEDRAADPAVEAALACLDRHAPLREGEKSTHFRFWMAADTYQGVSALQSLIFLKIAQHYLTAPGLAFTFFPAAEPDFWAPFCGYAELDRTPEADYEVGGRRYGVFTHDWRAVPPMLWLDHLAARELATTEELPPAEPAAAPVAVLSEEAFLDAVHNALRCYARPVALADSPLLRSRLVLDRVGPEADDPDRIEALRALLCEAAQGLEATPRDAKLFRALERGYLRPAPSQEIAAELLDLPLSTFRRHLKTAVERVAETLWQRERRA